jgi:DNA N-6-adenine-methyltransferase (Dam)
MTDETTFVTRRSRKRVTKIGRPPIRKDGRPLTPAERMRRYRAERKRERCKSHRVKCSGNFEWYTPRQYVEAAREALGSIDLDPASSEIAQTVIQAGIFFDARDDGLAQQWHGNVLLNPPYARNLIGRFVDKLLGELAVGRVQQAILLTHSYMDTAWFRRAALACAAMCHARRIRFWTPDGDVGNSPTTGSTFFYYGPHLEQFRASFEKFGMIR